ncbi:Glutathione S-transferase [Quillaja saponaria]|uniref:Glutathione S-transferase n=1 Tax=Quillaja saponaria TaxID=32244 RepID=A0AAD7L9W4_QUISA|nr:Glutathione S-transferase [Quillaja saponaria]
MEEKHSEVVLLGTFGSSYCTRIVLALKLKGIPYKYVEEDLKNKSELLLHHNPVHKKVPVLVHNGRAISESLVILEYIDEQWNHNPRLLPEDPYERAKLRFWINYYDQKVKPGTYTIILSKGKEQEKAIEDYRKLLRVFEEGIKKDFPGRSNFCKGETLGLLDIIVGTNACNYKAFHEVVAVVIDHEKNPEFFSWVNALKEHPLMIETLPPHDKLVAQMEQKYSQLSH